MPASRATHLLAEQAVGHAEFAGTGWTVDDHDGFEGSEILSLCWGRDALKRVPHIRSHQHDQAPDAKRQSKKATEIAQVQHGQHRTGHRQAMAAQTHHLNRCDEHDEAEQGEYASEDNRGWLMRALLKLLKPRRHPGIGRRRRHRGINHLKQVNEDAEDSGHQQADSRRQNLGVRACPVAVVVVPGLATRPELPLAILVLARVVLVASPWLVQWARPWPWRRLFQDRHGCKLRLGAARRNGERQAASRTFDRPADQFVGDTQLTLAFRTVENDFWHCSSLACFATTAG